MERAHLLGLGGLELAQQHGRVCQGRPGGAEQILYWLPHWLEWRWVMAHTTPGSLGSRFAPTPPICRHPDPV